MDNPIWIKPSDWIAPYSQFLPNDTHCNTDTHLIWHAGLCLWFGWSFHIAPRPTTTSQTLTHINMHIHITSVTYYCTIITFSTLCTIARHRYTFLLLYYKYTASRSQHSTSARSQQQQQPATTFQIRMHMVNTVVNKKTPLAPRRTRFFRASHLPQKPAGFAFGRSMRRHVVGEN